MVVFFAQNNEITKTIAIPSEHHGFIVGTGGKNIQKITADRNVNIKFPKRKQAGGKTEVAAAATKTEAVVASASAGSDLHLSATHSFHAVADAATNGDVAHADSVNGEIPLTESVHIDTDAENLAAVETAVSAEIEEVAVEAAVNPADAIVLKGLAANIELAIKDLLALVPETEEFTIANDLHGGLIGPKGEAIRKLMSEFDVNIKIPSQSQHADHIVLKGLCANIDKLKVALAKRVVDLEADKAVSWTRLKVLLKAQVCFRSECCAASRSK